LIDPRGRDAVPHGYACVPCLRRSSFAQTGEILRPKELTDGAYLKLYAATSLPRA
jgi:hypothetical protein